MVLTARRINHLNQLKQKIIENGGKAEVEAMDVMDATSVSLAVEGALKKCGRIDTLINNAGACADSLLRQFTFA